MNLTLTRLVAFIWHSLCQQRKYNQNQFMMRYLVRFIFVSTLFACNQGPTQEEIRIREEISKREEIRIQEEIRIHEEYVQVGKEKRRLFLENILDSLGSELEKGDKELAKTLEFRFLRAKSVKAREVQTQLEKNSEFERIKRAIEEELTRMPLTKSFAFQDDPQKLMEYIFGPMTDDKLSDFRFVLDPYGEYDDKIMSISMIHCMNEVEQNHMTNMFPMRIMPEPKIYESYAIYEIATGPGRDRLEKVKLIKRLDKWYLQDIDIH